MRKMMILAAVAAVVATPAFAQSGDSVWSTENARGYGTLGYTHFDGSSTGSVTGRMGIDLNRYLAIETEVGIGVKDKDFTNNGVDGTLKHEWDAAGYVVGKMPIGENFQVHARGGYGHTELKRFEDGSGTKVGGQHWVYGVGGEYLINADNGIRADWTRRDFKGSAREDLDTYGISYVRRF